MMKALSSGIVASGWMVHSWMEFRQKNTTRQRGSESVFNFNLRIAREDYLGFNIENSALEVARTSLSRRLVVQSRRR